MYWLGPLCLWWHKKLEWNWENKIRVMWHYMISNLWLLGLHKVWLYFRVEVFFKWLLKKVSHRIHKTMFRVSFHKGESLKLPVPHSQTILYRIPKLRFQSNVCQVGIFIDFSSPQHLQPPFHLDVASLGKVLLQLVLSWVLLEVWYLVLERK